MLSKVIFMELEKADLDHIIYFTYSEITSGLRQVTASVNKCTWLIKHKTQ